MEQKFTNIVFEPLDANLPKSFPELPPNLSEERKVVMWEFLDSGYLFDNHLYMDRFLGEDLTIDLEKLELGISLTVEYLEFSVKFKNPIYVFLGNMDRYFLRRGIKVTDLDRVIEESSFILGFCQAMFDEESKEKQFIVQFARGDSTND